MKVSFHTGVNKSLAFKETICMHPSCYSQNRTIYQHDSLTFPKAYFKLNLALEEMRMIDLMIEKSQGRIIWMGIGGPQKFWISDFSLRKNANFDFSVECTKFVQCKKCESHKKLTGNKCCLIPKLRIECSPQLIDISCPCCSKSVFKLPIEY